MLDGSRSQVLPMLQPLYRSCSRRRRMLLGVWAVVFVTPLGLNSAHRRPRYESTAGQRPRREVRQVNAATGTEMSTDRRIGRGWVWLTTVAMLAIFFQSVTAGRILSGDDWARTTHRAIAGLLSWSFSPGTRGTGRAA